MGGTRKGGRTMRRGIAVSLWWTALAVLWMGPKAERPCSAGRPRGATRAKTGGDAMAQRHKLTVEVDPAQVRERACLRCDQTGVSADELRGMMLAHPG